MTLCYFFGFRIAFGLPIAAGLQLLTDCRITDSSRHWYDLYQPSVRSSKLEPHGPRSGLRILSPEATE
eukprot:3186509-Alexandrium_andersonii.AAC.1